MPKAEPKNSWLSDSTSESVAKKLGVKIDVKFLVF